MPTEPADLVPTPQPATPPEGMTNLDRSLIGLIVLFCLTGAVGLTFFLKARQEAAQRAAETVTWAIPDEHLVTPEQLAATAVQTGRQAAPFVAAATDGKTYRLAELAADRPIVLLFIKDGCPCSEWAQTYFNRLHEAYGDVAHVLGVINDEAEPAAAWAEKYRAAFPLLLDPEMSIIRDYGAESSVYVALIGRGGTLDEFWPGYSGDMLEDLGKRLAEAAGRTPVVFDTDGTPGALTTGCSFY